MEALRAAATQGAPTRTVAPPLAAVQLRGREELLEVRQRHLHTRLCTHRTRTARGGRGSAGEWMFDARQCRTRCADVFASPALWAVDLDVERASAMASAATRDAIIIVPGRLLAVVTPISVVG